MAEEKQIIINYQGREVKQEQLISYHGQQGETIYELQRKNCKLVFNSIGAKNVIAVTDQHGKPQWLGTYSNDIKIQSVDLVMFKEGYMTRFNCATVLDTTGIRYEVPAFNYFEQELIPEEYDTEETEPEKIEETDAVATMDEETTLTDMNEIIAKNVAEWRERSGLTD